MFFDFLIENLKKQNFIFVLENGVDQLRNIKSNEEIEQIVDLCSRYVCSKTIKNDQVSVLAEIAVLSMSSSRDLSSDVFMPLCYILVFGIKKELDIKVALSLVKEIENILNTNENIYVKHSDSLRKIYSTLWNLSLQKGLSPSDSLTLQGYALEFLCLTGENLNEVCNSCQRAGKLAEHLSCPNETLEVMYNKVLSAVNVYLKRKPSVHISSIITLNLVLIEYAKYLYKNKTCYKFSSIFKPIASSLEDICDTKVVLGFKMGVKMVEAGMAFMLGQCTEEMVTKLLKGCNVISKSSLPANTILVDGLSFVHQLMEANRQVNKLDALAESIFNCLVGRISKEDSLSKQSLIKLLEVFGNYLNNFVNLIVNNSTNKEELLNEALKLIEALKIMESKVEKNFGDTHIYNIGINCCNLGVIAFKSNNFSIAAEFLNIAVDYLYLNYTMCDKTQKDNVFNIMKKKAVLLKDSLRYCGKYKEAALKSVHLVAKDILPRSDIISTWIKCKRDALRAKSSSIKYSPDLASSDFHLLRSLKNSLSGKSFKNVDVVKQHFDLFFSNKSRQFYHDRIYKLLSRWEKKLCIKDIYSEVESESSTFAGSLPLVEELLLEEMEELVKFGNAAGDDKLVCSKALIRSDKKEYKLEGYLALAKTLWLHSYLRSDGETALQVTKDVLSYLEELSSQNKCEPEIYLEYKARAQFWFYLCNLQMIYEKAEVEVEKQQQGDEPLTAQSTDLGEEVQPDDACSVRPSTSVATFPTQELAFEYLRQTLSCWELLLVDKEKTPLHPSVTCNCLLSVGYIFKLSGLLPECIKAFGLVLSLAFKHDLHTLWIQGVIELIEIVPELVPQNAIQRLQSLLTAEESDVVCKLAESDKLASLAAISYYYYRTGKFIEGAEIVLDCLSNPVMAKKTPSANEAHVSVYFVASHYAFLPSSVLPSNLRPKEPCLFLALAATRKAIGLALIVADNSYYQENICWRHKVAWLHHATNLWLGRLCHITAQPRLARAYLRQALSVAEKLALPLRTVELLCTLAEIDLQCDQLDDCRVKIDSLDKLLEVHSSSKIDTLDQNTIEQFTNLNVKEESTKKTKPKKEDNRGNKGVVSVYVDNEFISEKLREGEEYPELSIPKVPALKLGDQMVVIGDTRRIPQLALTESRSNRQGLSSPSVGFREENFVVRTVVCPVGILDCLVCIAPELHVAAIRTQIAMGVIHAQGNNFRGARRCFNQAEDDLIKLFKSSTEISSKLSSILVTSLPSDSGVVTDPELCVKSHLALAKLRLLFYWNEVLCMEKTNWPEMESRISTVLTEVSNLSSHILITNHPLVLQLILQCKGISRTLHKRLENQENDIPPSDVSPSVRPSTLETDWASPDFKTPARSTLKKPSKNVLASKLRAPLTPFRIFTDDDDNTSSSGEKNPSDVSSGGNHQEKGVKNLTSSFGKLTLDGTNQNNESQEFSPVSSLNSSPFSQVLKLPNREDITTASNAAKISRPKKATSKLRNEKVPPGGSKIRKMVTRKGTSKPADEKATKDDDSPLIKNNLNLGTNSKNAPTTRASRNSEIKTYTRSTRTVSTSSTTDEAQSGGALKETRRQRTLRRL